jgi:phospholipid/cholesterol/gamma-HCH transport system substrate-binding protein
MGLREGDNVFLRGVGIGKIKRLQIRADGVHAVASLDQPVELHDDYRVEILPSSVLGGRYLNIYEGSEGHPMLSRSEKIKGTTPVDLIDAATKTIQSVKQALEEGGVLENLKSAMAQIKDITTRLNNGEGTIGKLMTDDKVYNDLQQISANFKEVSQRLANGEGALGKLMSKDDKLYSDLSSAAASVKQITDSLAKGEGTMGKLIKDDTIYQEAKLTLQDIRAAVDDFRETTPITLFSSVFFGAF